MLDGNMVVPDLPGFGMPLVSLVALDVPAYEAGDCPLCRDGLPLVKPGSRARPGGE